MEDIQNAGGPTDQSPSTPSINRHTGKVEILNAWFEYIRDTKTIKNTGEGESDRKLLRELIDKCRIEQPSKPPGSDGNVVENVEKLFQATYQMPSVANCCATKVCQSCTPSGCTALCQRCMCMCMCAPEGALRNTSPVVTRAKLYSSLIAHALKFVLYDFSQVQPDVSPEFNQGKPENLQSASESGIRSTHCNVAISEDTVLPNTEVLSYLWGKLEEDDDVMTLIYLRPEYFEKYPIPYFEGCTLEVVQQVSKLWLSCSKLSEYRFKLIFDPIIAKLETVYDEFKASITERLTKQKYPDFNDFIMPKEVLMNDDFVQAKQMLCKELLERGAKAGARLLYLLVRSKRHDNPDICMVGELVKETLSRPHDTLFKKHFLELDTTCWSELRGRHRYTGIDEEDDRGQSVAVGLLSSHTDYNLLSWAARRGYADLVWSVVEIYKPSSKSDLYNYVNHVMKGTDAWKCALWCATRHGRTKTIRELLAPNWITSTIDFNDYPWGWLPPLHLVALLGNVDLLTHLAKVHSGDGKSGANGADKRDYLGRTPLDYAMPSLRTTTRLDNAMKSLGNYAMAFLNTVVLSVSPNNGVNKNNEKDENNQKDMKTSQKDKKKKDTHENKKKDIVFKLLLIHGVEKRLNELYEIYINQANAALIGAALIASVAFVGWLQPPLGYQNYFQFSEPSPPAQPGTFDSYIAIEGHLTIQVFIVCNALSFFLAIATMLIGAEATLFVHDKREKTKSLLDMLISVRWLMRSFICSMLCIMAAFICAGLVVLPPIRRFKWSMIVSLSVGSLICAIPLWWILSSLSENRIPEFTKPSKLRPRTNKECLLDSYSEEQCQKLFEELDINKDDCITGTELLNMRLGDNEWTNEEVDQIIHKVDGNGDYRLTNVEFKKMFIIMPVKVSEQLPSSNVTSHDKLKLDPGQGNSSSISRFHL